MLMPLQGFDKRGKKRDEAFGTNPVGGVPDQEQRVLDFWPVMARTPALKIHSPSHVCLLGNGPMRNRFAKTTAMRCFCEESIGRFFLRQCALGCLLSQLSLGFKFDQLQKIFNDQIALEFFEFLFGKRALTLSMDEFVCSFSDLGRGMESKDLFRSWMIGEKPCNFSSGLCFVKHSHFLLLQQRMSRSNSLHGSFLTIHPEHIIEEAVLQKHCEDALPILKKLEVSISGG
jgi:hypothetical protein